MKIKKFLESVSTTFQLLVVLKHCIITVLGIVFLSFHSPAFAAPDTLVNMEDWSQATGLGWPNGLASTHTFTNYKGSVWI